MRLLAQFAGLRTFAGTMLWLAALTLEATTAGSASAAEARAQPTQEYDLKAVLLYNFTQFVDWPPEAFVRPDAPWVIGILGHDPFGRVLDNVVRTEVFKGRRIVVERYHALEAVRDCQILFVAESEASDLPRILAAIRKRAILSVGDFEGFAPHGGMILFKKSPEGKIQLRINLPAIREAGLTVSAKLLRVAEVVSSPDTTP